MASQKTENHENVVAEALKTDKSSDFTVKNGLLKAKNKNSVYLSAFGAEYNREIGRLLAERLSLEFVDVEKKMEIQLDMSPAKMVETMGEEIFRVAEHSYIDKLAREKNLVVSCGEGALITSKNYFTAAKNGVVIYIEADDEEILKGLDEKEKTSIRRKLILKKPLYKKYADATVSFDGDCEKTLKAILDIL